MVDFSRRLNLVSISFPFRFRLIFLPANRIAVNFLIA